MAQANTSLLASWVAFAASAITSARLSSSTVALLVASKDFKIAGLKPSIPAANCIISCSVSFASGATPSNLLVNLARLFIGPLALGPSFAISTANLSIPFMAVAA